MINPVRTGTFRGAAYAHNVPTPEDVEKVMKKVEEVGAKITKPPQKADWEDIAVISPIPMGTFGKWHGIPIGLSKVTEPSKSLCDLLLPKVISNHKLR